MNHRTPASATPIHLVAGIPVSSLKIMYLISHHWSRGLHLCNSRTIDHAINKNESMNETTNVGGISNDIAPKPRNRITDIRNECQTPGIVDLIFMGTFFFRFFLFQQKYERWVSLGATRECHQVRYCPSVSHASSPRCSS
jgi:hypothetical protein